MQNAKFKMQNELGRLGNNGRAKSKEQRAKSKDERLGNLRSLGSLKSLGTTQRTLCVIIGFSGLVNTLVEGTMKKRYGVVKLT